MNQICVQHFRADQHPSLKLGPCLCNPMPEIPPKKPSDVASDNSTVENEEDDTSTGDVEYMDLDPEYVFGSDSDLLKDYHLNQI